MVYELEPVSKNTRLRKRDGEGENQAEKTAHTNSFHCLTSPILKVQWRSLIGLLEKMLPFFPHSSFLFLYIFLPIPI